MTIRDWLINEKGEEEKCNPVGRSDLSSFYRIYHFLHDLEEVLRLENDDRLRLSKIRPMVRRLLMSSYWIQKAIAPIDPKTGWSLRKLYDEPLFPWTIQTALWDIGQDSPIHNHGTWGVVAIISGIEQNSFWRRTNPSNPKDLTVEKTGECTLYPGDLISFLPETIHSIRAVGESPVASFKIYGEPQSQVVYFNSLKLEPSLNLELVK
jgi:predicted metal-dependent enzyme (double-stranded beta helix superfamily)